jgi:protein-disulfide isomerase
VTDLGSAPLPPLGADDHVRGPDDAPVLVFYGSFECHFCLMADLRLEDLALRRVFRHFPVRSKHPRAWPAACAAEAAALQGRFWEFHDALYADQGRLEDPHLWARAEALGLDVSRFDADRRSDAVAERVRRDFNGAVRAGVVTTPTLFAPDGSVHAGAVGEETVATMAANLPRRFR